MTLTIVQASDFRTVALQTVPQLLCVGGSLKIYSYLLYFLRIINQGCEIVAARAVSGEPWRSDKQVRGVWILLARLA